MEAVVLHRVGFFAYSCPKQGQDFKPSAAPLHPNMGQVPPPPGGIFAVRRNINSRWKAILDASYAVHSTL